MNDGLSPSNDVTKTRGQKRQEAECGLGFFSGTLYFVKYCYSDNLVLSNGTYDFALFTLRARA